MACRKEWNIEFVDSQFTKVFRKNELKTHRQNVLLGREKAMLPATMVRVDILARAKERNAQIVELRRQIQTLYHQIDILHHENYHEQHVSRHGGGEEEKRVFRKHCPRTGCNAFLSTQYKCSTCDTWMCPECEKIKASRDDPEHQCNPDDVESVKLKKQECKPCPSCGIETFKIDGCYQVWCPPPCGGGQGTAWDFRTGKLDRDRPHAPLYYEYQRKMNGGVAPRNPGDNPCGVANELPDFRVVRRVLQQLPQVHQEDAEFLKHIHRILVHVQNVTMRQYYENREVTFETNVDLRMAFLQNEIDEETMKMNLQKREKDKNKRLAMHDAMELLVNVGKDIYNNLINMVNMVNQRENNTTTTVSIEDTFKELEQIRLYFNETITNVRRRFDSKALFHINEKWEI